MYDKNIYILIIDYEQIIINYDKISILIIDYDYEHILIYDKKIHSDY